MWALDQKWLPQTLSALTEISCSLYRYWQHIHEIKQELSMQVKHVPRGESTFDFPRWWTANSDQVMDSYHWPGDGQVTLTNDQMDKVSTLSNFVSIKMICPWSKMSAYMNFNTDFEGWKPNPEVSPEDAVIVPTLKCLCYLSNRNTSIHS